MLCFNKNIIDKKGSYFNNWVSAAHLVNTGARSISPGVVARCVNPVVTTDTSRRPRQLVVYRHTAAALRFLWYYFPQFTSYFCLTLSQAGRSFDWQTGRTFVGALLVL